MEERRHAAARIDVAAELAAATIANTED